MIDYTVDEAEFTDPISITETTDPGHADYINAAPKQLFGNTKYNKAQIEALKTAMADYALVTEAGYTLALSIDTTSYIMSLSLKNKAGTVLSTGTIDFPLESMVVSAAYADGKITLTLQNGETTSFSVADLVSGLVSESRKIAGIDLADDITVTELLSALGVESGANKTTVDSALSSSSSNPVANSVITKALAEKSDISHTHATDTTVTNGSSNLITSGAVYKAISELKTKLYVRSTDEDDPTSAYGAFNTSDGTVYDSYSDAYAAVDSSSQPVEIIFLPGTHKFTKTIAYYAECGVVVRGLNAAYRECTILDFTFSSYQDSAFIFYNENIGSSYIAVPVVFKDLKICCSSSSEVFRVINFRVDCTNSPSFSINNVHCVINADDGIPYAFGFAGYYDGDISLDISNCVFEGLSASNSTSTTCPVQILRESTSYSGSLYVNMHGNIVTNNEFSYYTSIKDNYYTYINSYGNYGVTESE